MAYGTINADLMTTSDGVSSSGLYGFKNRIINGAMVIDQRNAGASVTPTTSGAYIVDRWGTAASQNSKFTIQQNAASITPPTGFINYLGSTSSSAYSIAAGDYFLVYQPIEGLNIADLGWGTASAKTVTLSFQVYSSLTGTFGGSLRNSASNRCYPFSYTVSTANTWTQISITIAGDTSGTWLTTNGVGIYVSFSLGTGATYSATAGAWAAGTYFSATGATSVVGTNSATFYITGVQLEKGSTATSFDYRPYSAELAMCQRYFVKFGGNNASETVAPIVVCYATSACQGNVILPVSMRTTPSASLNSLRYTEGTNLINTTGGSYYTAESSPLVMNMAFNGGSGMVQYRPGWMETQSTSGYILVSAEL